MTTPGGRPADWYEDPANEGELRYFDGTDWTEHVTVGGVQTTAPVAPAELASQAEFDPESAPSFTVTRIAQGRTEVEKPLEVVSPEGALGKFVTTLDGAPGYRFQDGLGGTVVSLYKPSLKNAVDVFDSEAHWMGAITKVGRLHSRYDIARADSDAVTTVRLLAGAADEWELHSGRVRGARIQRTTSSLADSLNLAGVVYSVNLTAPVDHWLQLLLLAVPVAIDILDTQAF